MKKLTNSSRGILTLKKPRLTMLFYGITSCLFVKKASINIQLFVVDQLIININMMLILERA